MDIKEKLLEKLIDALLMGDEGEKAPEEMSEMAEMPSEEEAKPEYCDGCDRSKSECICDKGEDKEALSDEEKSNLLKGMRL